MCGEMLREGRDRKEGIFRSVKYFLLGVERLFEFMFWVFLVFDGNGYVWWGLKLEYVGGMVFVIFMSFLFGIFWYIYIFYLGINM